MKKPNWVSEKDRFSHNWLSNTFHQALGGLINACEGKVFMNDIRASLQRLIDDWQANIPVAKRLIRTCEEAMSPKVRLKQAPLAYLDDEDKDSLGAIVHRIWLERYNIRQILAEAEQAIDEADQNIGMLCALLTESDFGSSALSEYSRYLSAIQSKCVALTAAMSKLPKHIMV